MREKMPERKGREEERRRNDRRENLGSGSEIGKTEVGAGRALVMLYVGKTKMVQVKGKEKEVARRTWKKR